MIKSFKDGQLRKFWKSKSATAKGINPVDSERIRGILNDLDAATVPEDMAPLGYGFHPLKGNRKGQFGLTIRANWRIVFEWEEGHAVRVRQEDYHGK
jgi:proteic killer suppression protein